LKGDFDEQWNGFRLGELEKNEHFIYNVSDVIKNIMTKGYIHSTVKLIKSIKTPDNIPDTAKLHKMRINLKIDGKREGR
jgi:hypothetical protein